ncbi:MAG: hypothetical protein LBM98_02830 [Oscillospiraceae bacterium]|nr:hypothetical protein [Oscillospiraceae bacterium]
MDGGCGGRVPPCPLPGKGVPPEAAGVVPAPCAAYLRPNPYPLCGGVPPQRRGGSPRRARYLIFDIC